MRPQNFVPSMLLCALFAGIASAQGPEGPNGSLPVVGDHSANYYQQPLTGLAYRQAQARFQAEQRLMRIEWNNWTGFSPLRPTINASYMSYTSPRYYIPARGVIVNTGLTRGWYW